MPNGRERLGEFWKFELIMFSERVAQSRIQGRETL